MSLTHSRGVVAVGPHACVGLRSGDLGFWDLGTHASTTQPAPGASFVASVLVSAVPPVPAAAAAAAAEFILTSNQVRAWVFF